MASKLTEKGNYLIIEDTVTGKTIEFPKDKVRYEDEDTYIVFYIVGEIPKYVRLEIADIVDSQGISFVNTTAILYWLQLNTGGLKANLENASVVLLNNTVDSGNSTSVVLGANEVFTGQWFDTLNYGTSVVSVASDQDSALNGVEIQYSHDSSHVDQLDNYTVLKNIGKVFSFGMANRYIRIVFTNGSIAQTVFDLQVIHKSTAIKNSSHRISDNIVGDDDAELIKAVLTGRRPDDIFANIGCTRLDNLKVSVQEYGDTSSIDAFDRLRVSEPYTLFDSKQLHDKQPLFWDESIGGSATSIHGASDACTNMTVTASASDYVIRQTKQRFNYQPGKSQLILMTFQGAQQQGLTKKVGLFDGIGTNNLTANNGIFFETDGNVSWNIAKNGTTTETAIQSNWNVDKLDGTGASGITLNFSSAQILIIDFEWLGVGRVRVGFVINGIIYYCHYFNHANNTLFPTVYMSTPNLPLRYEVRSNGTASGTFSHICSSVMSEGGIQETGLLTTVDNGITHVDANIAGTTYALLGIQLKSAYKDITVSPTSASVLAKTNDSFKWSLRLNPIIDGTFTFSDVTNSAVQVAYGVTANTVTGGIIIMGGYVSVASKSSSNDLQTALRIGTTIAGVSDKLVLCCTSFTPNADVLGSLTFRELL